MGPGSTIEILAERVRAGFDRPIIVKRMFGGLTFMIEGNMLCCVSAMGCASSPAAWRIGGCKRKQKTGGGRKGRL